MTYAYHISGMTCGGCRNTVQQALSKVADVIDVEVNLETERVTVTADRPIQVSLLQEALPGKYQLSEFQPEITPGLAATETVTKKSKWRQLKPLFLILSYTAVASTLLNYQDWHGTEFMLDFMGLFYIVFSFFKLLDIKGFQTSFRMYDPLAKMVPFYGWIYPFIEVALGLMFLMRIEVTIALVVTLVVLGITTIGVGRVLLSKKKIRCACLGTVLQLPMTEATFIENAIMLGMAMAMLL